MIMTDHNGLTKSLSEDLKTLLARMFFVYIVSRPLTVLRPVCRNVVYSPNNYITAKLLVYSTMVQCYY